MKSYSPYENVAAQKYPAILAMTSLHDTRVYYVEAGEMGCGAAAHQDRRQSGAVEDSDDRRPRWYQAGATSGGKEAAYQYAWLLAAADRDHYGSGQVDDLLSGAQG